MNEEPNKMQRPETPIKTQEQYFRSNIVEWCKDGTVVHLIDGRYCMSHMGEYMKRDYYL
ncbi:hypothetical protein JW968_00680 [Candidatus Woesearchaeota archaeon]|nr:hypothetical protein [Candidatus Woesearchaeota archaeon]